MKLTFLFTGKTRINYIEKGIEDYFGRLKHYIKTEIRIIPDIRHTKNMPEAEQVKKEGEGILKEVPAVSTLILLDERGKKFSSLEFSEYMKKKILESKDIFMAIGGAYGFSEEVLNRGDIKISLSTMTFSHQMVRMILLEQVYRSFTIIRGEPYHHC